LAQIVRFHENGGPEVLRVEEGDPGEPGPGEVLLKIDAIGLNRSEAAFRGGHYLVKAPLPCKVGVEASGTITKVGPEVEGWAVGDAVNTLPAFPVGKYGVYASEAVIPANALLKIPEGIDPVASAATWMAYLTAYGGMVESGALKAGEFVIITAASSSVGLAAIQIAKDFGAIPIGATRGSSKAEAIRAAGAAHVIATDEQDIVAEVQHITDGKGVTLIFDPVGGPYAEKLAECLTDEGVLIIYGGLANAPMTFPRHVAIRRNLTIRGYSIFALVGDKKRLAAAQDYLTPRLRDGRFTMPIATRIPLADAAEAHRVLEANQHIGKIVMVP
jgi:NADPH:quinone reductase-like Zn-dependent oxidoreductase